MENELHRPRNGNGRNRARIRILYILPVSILPMFTFLEGNSFCALFLRFPKIPISVFHFLFVFIFFPSGPPGPLLKKISLTHLTEKGIITFGVNELIKIILSYRTRGPPRRVDPDKNEGWYFLRLEGFYGGGGGGRGGGPF